MASPDPAPRRGWYATPKAARDAIRAWFDGAETCATALAVFDALCEIANDKGAPSFVTDQPWIAAKAGCGVRTVRARLRDLEQVGVVRCVVPKLRGPATFAVGPLVGVPPFGNNGATFGDNCPTFGKDARWASLPTTEEQQNNEEQPLPGLARAGEELPAKSHSARKPDPAFDALAAATGRDPKQMTPSEARACGVALAEIRKASPDLTEAEIRRRVENYRAHFPEVACTPSAIKAHWSLCSAPPTPGAAQPKGSRFARDLC